MELAAAKRAGEIAAAIQSRLDKMAEVDRCLAEGWIIEDALARAADNRTCRLVLSALDATTNAAALGFIRQIYEGQIAVLQAELATAETWTPPAPAPPE